MKLNELFPNFEERPGQEAMRLAVAQAYEAEQTVLIEAGTGIGKTFAYLLPAVLWAERYQECTVISTHTISLQQQLVEKDIPFLLKQLNLNIKVVLLKGMRHFSCLKKEAEGLSDTVADYESCTHSACPFYQKCPYFKQRRAAETAQLLVVNHHLLLADLALRRTSKGQFAVLPEYHRVILDEAHHLEDVATEHFATTINRTALIKLVLRVVKDTLLTRQEDVLALHLPLKRRELLEAIDACFLSLDSQEENIRLTEAIRVTAFWQQELGLHIQHAYEEGRAFLELVSQLQLEEEVKSEVELLSARLQESFALMHAWVFQPLHDNEVRWIEQGNFVAASLDIAPFLKEELFNKLKTVVLCSATLTASKNFEYLCRRLGIEQAQEHVFESPFDYVQQALFAVPEDLPDPDHPDFMHHATLWIYEALCCSGGHAFVLFTSYTMLKECQRRLQQKLQEGGFILFTQGELERHELLEAYRSTPRAVLFGTDSFWEGVDVVGENLRLVMLMRLPFKSPSDPLFQARSEKISKEGGSPFFDYALPQAIVKFRQGFGRLIRHKNDRGSIVCLDRRLIKKGYGKRFFRSLPNCPVHIASCGELSKTLRAFYGQSLGS